MPWLDIATFFSYVALNVDILLQIKRIHITQSSDDLSLLGMSVRYVAILVILFKFTTLGDLPLIVGQGLITLSFSTYFVLAVYYYRRRSQRHTP